MSNPANQLQSTETVILLHGLSRTSRSMRGLERHLVREGYEVFNIGYPSRKLTLQALQGYLTEVISSHVAAGSTIHFVGHSLGGVLSLGLSKSLADRFVIGRTVMIGSPVGGARIARFLARYRLLKGYFGPVLSEIGASQVVEAPSPQLPNIGVIYGSTGYSFGLLPLLGEDNDGIVLVSESCPAGFPAFRVPFGIHGLLMYHRGVPQAVKQFLRHGEFAPQ